MREKRSALPMVALLVALVALAGVVWTRFDPPQWKPPAAMSLVEMGEMMLSPSMAREQTEAGAVKALKELGPHLDDWARQFVRATIDDDMERTVGLVMHGREDGVPFSVRIRAAPSRGTAIVVVFMAWNMVRIRDDSTTEEKARAFGRMLARFYKKTTSEDE